MPGSPSISTAPPRPAVTSVTSLTNVAISASRPTSALPGGTMGTERILQLTLYTDKRHYSDAPLYWGPFLLIEMPFISGRVMPSLQVAAQVYRNFQATFITRASEISQAGSSGTLAASFVL